MDCRAFPRLKPDLLLDDAFELNACQLFLVSLSSALCNWHHRRQTGNGRRTGAAAQTC
eukprot:SAG31_NODE_31311_length_369_cov_1.333333_1_plen_57_part_10